MSDAAVRFAELYRGRTDLQGTEDGGCLHKHVTFGHYRGHLQGRFGLGVYPLRDDGTCAFAAVDVDRDDLDGVLLLQRLLDDAGLKSFLFTSKAKGYHVTVFVDGWARASHLRPILLAQLVEAGLPDTTEIYPRRDARGTESVAPGGYLRLPYLAALAEGQPRLAPAPGRRVAIDTETHRPLALEEFLERAEAGRVSPDSIRLASEEEVGEAQEFSHQPVRELPEDLTDLGLKPRFADLISVGWSQDCGYRSRSEAQQAVTDALVNSGHDDATIRAVLLHPAYGISDRARERSSSQAVAEIARCIAKARASWRPSRHMTSGLVPTNVHRHMVDSCLPPLAWPVLAEIAMTVDYKTGVSIVTMDSLAKRLKRSRASIHRDAIKPLRDAGVLEAVRLERQGGQWHRVGHRISNPMPPPSAPGSSEPGLRPKRECENKRSVYPVRHGGAQVRDAAASVNGTASTRRDMAGPTGRGTVHKSASILPAGTEPRLLGETR